MIWLLYIVLVFLAIHYYVPALAIRLAQQMMLLLYRTKMFLIQRRRSELHGVLLQITQDKAFIATEEQKYRRLLDELDGEEQDVTNYVSQYIDVER